LGIVLIAVTAILTVHQAVGGSGKPAGVDALCPLGGVETLYSLFTGDGFIRQTAASAAILLVGMLVMAVVYRRSFCGQLCPLGALQGLFGALGRRLFARRRTIPHAVDRVARWLKYGILAFFAVWSWQAAALVMRPYDPWVAWAHLTSTRLLAEFGVGLAVLIVSLAGSLVYERFFCKYLCPTGALLGLLAKVSIFRIERDQGTCIDCGLCDRACPMNVDVATASIVNSSECISCNECVNACPVAGALEVVPAFGRTSPVAEGLASSATEGAAPVASPTRRRPSTILAAGIVVALMVAIVGATTLSGSFDWTKPGFAEASGLGMHSGEGDGQGMGEGSGEGPARAAAAPRRSRATCPWRRSPRARASPRPSSPVSSACRPSIWAPR
jgi:ferredoxin